jgi:hypothetical protein
LSIVKIRSCIAFWILFLGLIFLGSSILSAEIKEDARWSIDFSTVSISEALHQLTQLTGIKIFTKTPLDSTISPKSYINQSIDQILKGILRNVNYAAIWYYGERGLDSVGILIFERDRGESPSHLPHVKRARTANHSLAKSPDSRHLVPRRQVSGQRKSLRRSVAPKRVQEASSEISDEEGSEAEEEDEESIRSSMEMNDTSAPDSPDSQEEEATDSSEEEGLQTDQQNEDEESGSSTTNGATF